MDVSALVDILGPDPIYLTGHSLGGIVASTYAGVYPERVRKLVSIEGLGFPLAHRVHAPAPKRFRTWIEQTRRIEQRQPHSYPNLAAAVARMKEANPHLSDEVAEHLTLHGTNWNADGSIIWKFDNFARLFPPYGHNFEDAKAIYGNIAAPTLFFWGTESFMADPHDDERLLGDSRLPDRYSAQRRPLGSPRSIGYFSYRNPAIPVRRVKFTETPGHGGASNS